MSKNYKISIYFILLSIIFICVFVFFSKKIVVNTPDSLKMANHFDEANATGDKLREAEYLENIDKILKNSHPFMDYLNKDDVSKSERFFASSTVLISQSIEELSETRVPVKFKSYHLLLSRSLLLLSTYIKSGNDDDLRSGLLLYEEAENDFKRLTYLQ